MLELVGGVVDGPSEGVVAAADADVDVIDGGGGAALVPESVGRVAESPDDARWRGAYVAAGILVEERVARDCLARCPGHLHQEELEEELEAMWVVVT